MESGMNCLQTGVLLSCLSRMCDVNVARLDALLRDSEEASLLRGTRIRTRTVWTKTRCATVTPFPCVGRDYIVQIALRAGARVGPPSQTNSRQDPGSI